jgi:hypothetical protein
MPAATQAYFKTHGTKTARAKFRAAQRVKLGRLRDAAACEVLDPAPKFDFGIGVTDAEQQEVRDDVAFALGQLRSLTGVTLQGPTIYVSRDAQQLAEWATAQYKLAPSALAVKLRQYQALGTTAEAGDEAVLVVALSPTWQRADAASRQEILAHELFHLVQEQLMGRPDNWAQTSAGQIRPSGPVWLTEGTAEVVGYQVAAARGLFDLPSQLAALREEARYWATPLSRFETYAGSTSIGTAYHTMWFAANRLIEQAPRGLASALRYWSSIGAGASWRDAFAKAFGKSVDAFYSAFAAYRATL